MYTPMYTGLEFFMGTIVQLADLMEAATWMAVLCTTALRKWAACGRLLVARCIE